MQKILAIVAILVAGLVFGSTPALADKPEIFVKSGGVFSKGWTYALNGMDPVSYFTDGKPVKGSESYTATYKGATFSFTSQDHKAMFEADPAKYAPQYGGYCAWATSQGYTADGDPEVWKIVDGKLYLNYSKGVQKKWNKDIPGFIVKANANWPTVLTK